MPRYKEIKTRIQNQYPKLPQKHKQLADYFIEYFDKIPFLTVHQISEATSLSVASVVRFAQRIGFKGFLEMRDQISAELQTRIHNKEIFSLVDNGKIKNDILASVANLDIKNINDTLHTLDRKSYEEAIKMIINAKRVYTAGLGISFLLARVLAYQLNQVAIDARNFNHDDSTFMEQVLFMNKDDLIIAFSYPPYSKETVDMARMAKEKKIKVISFTNKDASPITYYSDASLIVKSNNLLFTNSFAAISVVINAIATQCAYKNKAKTENILKEMNDIADLHDLIVPDDYLKKNFNGD
jgi:DNA-binding MurR/RpiR family transcriptional regulator